MNHKHQITNAILWAAAILASAIMHAPVALTIIILPTLSIGSLLLSKRGACEADEKSK